MFKNQIGDLRILEYELTESVSYLEEKIKVEKVKLKDISQAIASLEKLQSKYSDKEESEEFALCLE